MAKNTFGDSPFDQFSDEPIAAKPAQPKIEAPTIRQKPVAAPDFDALFDKYGKEYGVPPSLLRTIAQKESSLNPNAVGATNENGTTDYGLMQHNSRYHKERGITNWRDPEQSVKAAAALLKSNFDTATGDWRQAVRRYNGSGPRAEAYADDVMAKFTGKARSAKPASIDDQFSDEPIQPNARAFTADDFSDDPIEINQPLLALTPEQQRAIDEKPLLGYLKDKGVEGFGNMEQSLNVARWAVAGGDPADIAEQLAKQFASQAQAAKSTGEKEMDAAYKEVTDAKGVVDTTIKGGKAIYTAITNPKALAGEVVGQAANSLPTIGAGAVGAGTGAGVGALAGAVPGAIAGAVIGGRTGMAAGTTATELGGEVTDMIGKRLAESKQPPTAQNILAILSDKQFQNDALKQGLQKGLTVAAIDQVFMGIGGKVATAPVRKAATKQLAEQGIDVSTAAARKAALASPAGRAAVEAAKPTVAARVGAGAAATGVDSAGEVIGEGVSQQVARGEVDYGDALREGVASLGQSVVEPAIGGAMDSAKAAADAARATVRPVPNTPSESSGPLQRATENAAAQPDRVTATAPDGSKVTGTVTGTSEDGKVQIVDDNGEIVTFQTGPNGVKIEPAAPIAPLSNAVEAAAGNTAPEVEVDPRAQRFTELARATSAAEKQSDPATWTPEERAAYDSENWEEFSRLRGYTPEEIAQYREYTNLANELIKEYGVDAVQSLDMQATEQPATVQPAQAATETVAEKETPAPVEPPKPPALSEMDEPALRTRLKYLADQAKNNGGWDKMLVAERRKVEREINARVKSAQPALDLKPETPQPKGTLNAQTTEAQQATTEQPAQAAEVAEVTQPAPTGGTSEEGAGESQPPQAAPSKPGSKAGPASLGSVKADMDHLFGVDAKRAKAIDRIAAGKAWFNDGVKAKDFISKNGLKDTHEVKQGKGGRFDVVAKQAQAKTSEFTESPDNKAWDRFTQKGVTVDFERGEGTATVFEIASKNKRSGEARKAIQALKDKVGTLRAEGVVEDSAEAISFWQSMLNEGVVDSAILTNGKKLTKETNVNDNSPSGKPAGAEEVAEKADAVSAPAATVQPETAEEVAPKGGAFLTEAEQRSNKLDADAGELARQLDVESDESDFDPKETSAAAAQWAKDAGFTEAEFKDALIKSIEKRGDFRRKAGVLAALRADQKDTGKSSDAPYLGLLSLKSTTLLSDSGGRKLYAVTLTPAFKNKFFEVGRGFNLPRSDAFELKEKARVTGVVSDTGYILIDRREQQASRANTPEVNTSPERVQETGKTEQVDQKAKWLKAINDQNRLAGDTGVQLAIAPNGKLTFMGDPRSTKAGRALEATLDEARKAGATNDEIIASIQGAKAKPVSAEVKASSTLDDRWDKALAEARADGKNQNKDQLSYRAFTALVGSIGENPMEVWGRWSSFIGSGDLTSKTGEQLLSWMEDKLPTVQPMGDHALPGRVGDTSTGTVPYWSKAKEELERRTPEFNRYTDKLEKQARDVEELGGSKAKADAVRKFVMDMNKQVRANEVAIERGLKDAEKREAEEEAKKAAAEAAKFHPADLKELAKKPTPASVSGWSQGVYKGEDVWTNGHIVDLVGEPHLSGWKDRLNTLRKDYKVDVDRVTPKTQGEKTKAIGVYDGNIGLTKGLVYLQASDELIAVSRQYYQYFASKFKGAEFHFVDHKSPLNVYQNGKRVGILSPIKLDSTTLAGDMGNKLAEVKAKVAANMTVAQQEAVRPAEPKKQRAVKPKASEVEAARAAYFTPGNIVKSYGGHDEVLAYHPPTEPGGQWSVDVHAMVRKDGQWMRSGKPQDARTHSTQPDASEMKKGPVVELDYMPGGQVQYTEARGDGKPFPNAPDRGVKPVEQVAEKPAQTKAAPISDFGQKLEGARKDYATQLKDAMDVDVAAEPLSKSWPEPDYQKMIDAGADKSTVAIVRAMRDELPTKPVKAWKLKGWVEKVQSLREFSSALLDGSQSYAKVREQMEKIPSLRDNILGRAELYEAVGHDKSLKGVTLQNHHYSVYRGQTNVKKWAVEKEAKSTAFGNWPREIAVADTKEDAIAEFKRKYDSLELGSSAKAKPSFTIYQRRGKPGAFVGKKIGREYIDLHKADDLKAARDYLQNNVPALEKALEAYKDTPYERNTENAPRVGGDHRNGANVTPEIFSDTFGFRGVQFGNYVEQGRRQSDLNEAYDALMDMAAVLGVPPRAISLNGRLGLSFGARGKGGKNAPAAHYEPGNVVINLTNGGGPGSLAHEWWHAMDNYFAKDGGGGDYMTAEAKGDKLREQMRQAFTEVKRAIRAGALRQRSMELDKRRTKPYWATPEEMSARSFESYVIAKLNDQSASNDYLANIVDEKVWNISEEMRAEFGGEKSAPSYPYPTADELPPLRAAFDDFFKTAETKQDDAGNVALRMEDEGQPYSESEMQEVGAAVEGKTVSEIASWLAENAPKPEQRAVAEKVSATIKRMEADGATFNFRVAHLGDVANSDLDHALATTHFSLSPDRTIKIDVSVNGSDVVGRVGTAYEPVLHELVHAVTVAGLELGSRKQFSNTDLGYLAEDLKEIHLQVMQEVRNRVDSGTATRFEKRMQSRANNGMANEHEIVAWALTNSDMQKTLESIPSAGGTLWSKFVTAIRKFLGLAPTNDTVLSDVLHIAEKVMDTSLPSYTKNFSNSPNLSIVEPTGTKTLSDNITKAMRDEYASWKKKPDAEAKKEDPAAFSRTAGEDTALQELSKSDDLFAMPKSTATDIEQIAKDIAGDTVKGVRTTKLGSETMYTIDFTNGATARITDRKASPYGNATQVYAMELDANNEMYNVQKGRPGENPEDAPESDDVWIDVSTSKPGEFGPQAYAIAAAYAHNTGKVFIGDPSGLSDAALRRRTEQMLSSALKYGTTDHLAPHPRQVAGSRELGVPALKWVYGDSIGNIERMIAVATRSLENAIPDISKHIRFNPATGEFTGTNGNVVHRERLRDKFAPLGSDKVRSGVLAKGEAGWRTLSRYAIYTSILEMDSGEKSKRGSILDQLGQNASRLGASDATERVFYSRGDVQPRSAEPNVARVERLANGIAARWDNRPNIIVAADMADTRIPAEVRAEDQKQRSLGANGEPRGFYYKGTVYLIAGQLNTPQKIAETLFHEALGHYGLRGLYGKALQPILRQIIQAKPNEIAARKGLDAMAAAEEILADMAQTRPELGFVKRAVAAIRTWLRENVPGFKDMALSDAEIIQNFILPARGWVERGQKANTDTGAPAASRAPAVVNEGLTPPEQGMLRKVQAAIQDNMNRVRQVQERIEKLTGSKLKEYTNYYGAETNRPGRIAARMEDAKNTLTGPLMERLAKSGNTPEKLSELLHAMHAQERNDRIAKINPEMPDGGSGMTNAQAAEVLAGYRDNKELHKLASEARAIAKATLETKLAYGLIDIDTFTTLAEVYQNYVPLKGDGEFGPKIKRAMGHDERNEHILENLARDYDQSIVVGERNLARQTLLQLVLRNPDSDLWTVGVPPKGRYVAGKTYSVMKDGKEVATFTSEAQVSAYLEGKGSKAGQYEVVSDNGERVQAFVKPLQDNEVMVYVDGQPVRIQIKDEKLASQLRPLDQGQMNVILEGMRSLNSYLSRIYTAYNPAFILRNTVRDAMTGSINMIGNEGAMTAAKAWANYPAALKAMGQFAATHETPSSEAGTYLNEYRMHGGKTGASWMSDLEMQGKSLQRMYDDAYGASGYLADGKVGKASLIAGRKILGGMAHVVEVANQATENGLRLALFMALRKQGTSPALAAQAAKSVTVDFDRKGTMTPALGAIYLFINPAIQGTANAIKTLAKGQHKKQAWMALGALGALGFYAASQGMDDDKDRWLGEGWNTRSSNVIMNIGGRKIQVPISFEFAPFYAFGAAMAEAMRGESAMKSAVRMMSSIIDAYVPLRGVFKPESDNHAADVIGAAMPTVLQPYHQSSTNRSVFGSKIVPESDYSKDKPDNLKMNRTTKNTAYDKAAQGIAAAGEAMGAGRYENDISKISPETLKHFYRTYTGGLGTFIADSIGAASMTMEDPNQVEASDVPIVKDFIKAKDVRPIRGRFYDLAGDVRAAASEFAQAKKNGDSEAMDKIMDNPTKEALISMDKLVSRTAKATARLRDEAVEVNADTTLSPAAKRAALKDLEAQEQEILKDAIEAFK